MLGKSGLYRCGAVVVLVLSVLVLAVLLPRRTASARDAGDHTGRIAGGGGTTIIHGGTGSPGFTPVLTTVAFHAEGSGGGVTGEFDCLALAPEAATGPGSGQFTVNAMYVVGNVTGASVHEDTATLTGTANITGLGSGTNIPYTFVVHKGGPGAAAVLTVNGLTFHEILEQGAFQVQHED